MEPEEGVVVRNGPKKYVAAPVILLFDAFLLATLVRGVIALDPSAGLSGMGPTGVAIWWIVVGPISLGLLYLGIFAFTLRMDFYPDLVRMRKVLFFKTLYVADMEKIFWGSFRTSTGYAGSPATAASRIRIVGPRRAAFLDVQLKGYDEAMEVVDGWVRRRPELVRGTNAERTFVGRGVLEPAEPGDDAAQQS